MKRSLLGFVGLLAFGVLGTTSCSQSERSLSATPERYDFGTISPGESKSTVITYTGRDRGLAPVITLQQNGSDLTLVEQPCSHVELGEGCDITVTLQLAADSTEPVGDVAAFLVIQLNDEIVNVKLTYTVAGADAPSVTDPTTTASPSTSAAATSTIAPTTVAEPTTAPAVTTATTAAGPPALSVSTSALEFGSVQYNAAARKVTVTNTGGGTLRFTSFHLAKGTEFLYVGSNSCQGASLSAGRTCSISIGVGATSGDTSPPPGDHSDSLTIASNAGNAVIALHFTTPA